MTSEELRRCRDLYLRFAALLAAMDEIVDRAKLGIPITHRLDSIETSLGDLTKEVQTWVVDEWAERLSSSPSSRRRSR